MSGKFTLQCGWCDRPAVSTDRLRCAACNGPMKVNVVLPRVAGGTAGVEGLRDRRLPGLWSWFDLLPVSNRGALVSLGEGGTPLFPSTHLGHALGLDTLFFKDETRNPTGSFKDRMLAVGITRAVELGKKTVAVQSSGNVGAAAAAYAARAGLRAKIFVPRTAPEEKILQIQMYGAEVFRVEHDSPALIFELIEWACQEFDWYLASTAAVYNPFTLEGAKTIAYEIAEQLAFDLPDWMIVPVGGGGNLGSLWRGFLDLRALGLVQRLPRMAGVQAKGCAPFVDAIRLGLSAPEALERRWPLIETLAGAIADDVVFDAHLALPAVRDSGGAALAVSDADVLAMQAALAASEGLFVEPASATSLAAIPALLADGRLERHHRVLVLLTGTGLKDPASARRLVRPARSIPPDRRALAALAAPWESAS